MRIGIPCQCCDALPRLYAEVPKDIRQLAGPLIEIRVSVAMSSGRVPRDDLLPGKEATGALQNHGDRQRMLHHETLHQVLLGPGLRRRLLEANRVPSGVSTRAAVKQSVFVVLRVTNA